MRNYQLLKKNAAPTVTVLTQTKAADLHSVYGAP